MRGYTEFGKILPTADRPASNPLWTITLSNRHFKLPNQADGAAPVVTSVRVDVFATSYEEAETKLADVFGADFKSDWSIDEIAKFR